MDELDHAEGANIGLLFFISCLRLNHKDIIMELLPASFDKHGLITVVYVI